MPALIVPTVMVIMLATSIVPAPVAALVAAPVAAMVAAIGGSGPALLLTGIFTVTAVLGQLISCTLDPRIHTGQHDDHATLLVPVFWPSRATWRSSMSSKGWQAADWSRNCGSNFIQMILKQFLGNEPH